MNELATPIAMLPAFVAASVLLAVTPGPGVAYIVTRTLAQGRAAGIASAAGVAVGNFANAAGAAFGLAALFAASALAFTVVKWVGAAYLVWLGIQLWRTPVPAAREPDVAAAAPAPAAAAPSAWRVARQGVVVSLLNPKTTLFFAAFLPQFVVAGQGSPLLPSLALGALFVAIAAATDLVYVAAAGWLAPRLQRGPTLRAGRRLGGAVFVGLGVLAALGERPASTRAP